MARLWQCGFEQNTTATDVEVSAVSGAPTISSTTKQSGSYALRISSLTSATRMGVRYQFQAAVGNGPFFMRAALYVVTVPSAENRIFGANLSATFTGTYEIYVTLATNGAGAAQLQLYDSVGAIGSASSALTLNTWYYVELKFDRNHAAGSQIVEGKLNGSVFATSSTRNIGAGIDNMVVGGNLAAEAQTTGEWFFDDLCVNNTTAGGQTGYPGDGRIVHLKPAAAGEFNQFTVAVGGDNTPGATNYTRVQEVTPDDVTTYNGDFTATDTDDYLIDAPSALGGSDVINVVAVGVRYRALVAATEAAFKVRLKSATGATPTSSAEITPNSVTWKTNANAAPLNYPIVTYADPTTTVAWTKTGTNSLTNAQVGMNISTTNINAADISTLWVSVDYTPVVTAVFRKTLSSVGTGVGKRQAQAS